MSKTTGKISGLIPLLLLVGAIVLIWTVTWPMIGELKVLSGQVGEKETILSTGRERIAAIQRTAAQISSLPSQKDLLDVAMPTDSDAAGALVQLNEMVSRAGLKIVSAQPGKAEKGILPMNIVVEGPFSNVLHLISLCELNLRPIQVSQIDATAVTDGSLSTTLDLSLLYLAATSQKESKEGENSQAAGTEVETETGSTGALGAGESSAGTTATGSSTATESTAPSGTTETPATTGSATGASSTSPFNQTP